MPAFDATPGSSAATSYASVEAADDYFSARLSTDAWDAALTPVREKALMAATARLEQESFAGSKASASQRLKWPRIAVYDDDRRMLPPDVVPEPVIAACCEVVITLLNAGATDLYGLTGLEGFEHVAIGDLDVTPRADAPTQSALPIAARRWLRTLLVTSTGMSKLVRG